MKNSEVLKTEERNHEIMSRSNSMDNPLLLPSATFLFQPNGLPFNAQRALNLNQAKVIVKIIEKLQDSIRETIENKRYRQNPLQLQLFQKDEDFVNLDFDMSDFDVNPANYNKLKNDVVELKNYTVKQDIIYYNAQLGKDIEALEFKNFLRSVKLPKKYERKITLSIDKDVAKLLVNVGEIGYTKYLLEIAMSAESKFTLLIYQLISGWREKGGFKLTIKNFKNKLGISDKYDKWSDLNRRVIEPAYRELFENADIWFEYALEEKDGQPYSINFKVVSGYYKVEKENLKFNYNFDFMYKVNYSSLSRIQLECDDLLRNELLFNNDNIILEIVSERYEDFFRWYKVNKSKLDKIDNPAGLLLSFLKMTAGNGWKERKFQLVYDTDAEEPVIADFSDLWGKITGKLKQSLSKSDFQTWIVPMHIAKIENSNIYLNVPTKFFSEYIENHFSETLLKSITKVLGDDKINLFYTIAYK